MRKELKEALKSTFAIELLSDSGSPIEGQEELYQEIEKFISIHILDKILELCDEEQLQSAEDMQYALEDIHEFVTKLKTNQLTTEQSLELDDRIDSYLEHPEAFDWEDVKKRLGA